MAQTILIPDFGGPFSLLLARRVREQGVFCEVCPPDKAAQRARELQPMGIILPGGGVTDAQICAELTAAGMPMLEINSGAHMMDKLHDFLFETCGASGDWHMDDEHIERMLRDIRAQVGQERVVLGLSGGVDSTVLAALLSKAIGSQLTCIFVDHGLMRLGEGDAIEALFAGWDLQFIRVNADERFLSKLRGVTDPESKRKIIGEEFIRVFEEESRKLGCPAMLSQGTIYPDIIESGRDEKDVIKSHHNVGGLPENMDFIGLVEPLRDLFKDEVRALGSKLGLPEAVVWRQPFPGPGLAVRVLGEITGERLDTLRQADHIFRTELENAGLGREINQYFAILTDLRTVGVQDDVRTYNYVLALRAVTTIDYMTAGFAHIPYETLELVSSRIIGEVPLVGRVVYDVTGKPPGTIEWE